MIDRRRNTPARTLLLLGVAGCSGGNAAASQDAGRTVVDAPIDAPFPTDLSSPTDVSSPTDTPPPPDVPAVDDRPSPADGGAALVRYTETRAACADRNPLRNAYFGDLHVHTSLSFDAYIFDNRNDPAAAYRFARGEEIRLAPIGPDGQGTRPARLDRPLDFAAVTDHSEFLGEVSLCITPGSIGYDSLTCRAYRSGNDTVGFGEFGVQLTRAMPARYALCGAANGNCLSAAGRIWQGVIAAAEAAYDRTSACRFSSLVAYEWTGTTGGSNLHRNVIFRNATVPALPVSYMEEPTPQGLWAALDARCTRGPAGCEVLAIPHNSNLSNGRMFALEYPAGASMDEQRRLAAQRAQLEPLVEMVQHKGASECSRAFSASDEACGFETEGAEATLCGGDGEGTGMACDGRGSYARYGLQRGLAEQARLGVNPLGVGFIASTDTHNSTPGNTSEVGFPGHVGSQDDTPAERLSANLSVFSPGGLAGVWAVENSRDALFEALQRRETFATSGTRIRVRFFGGAAFDAGLCADPMLLTRAYAGGVPMGGTLAPVAGGAPRFVVMATADATPLQRVEVVKVWIDAAGRPQERVVVVAGSASNGAAVDPATCATTPGAGQSTLCAVWTDDQYNPAQRAAWYVRVLENPTCRWSTRLCNSLPAGSRPASCTNGTLAATVQERAWSSPIFHLPAGG